MRCLTRVSSLFAYIISIKIRERWKTHPSTNIGNWLFILIRVTGAQLCHNDFRIIADRSPETIWKTERQRKDVSNIFNCFMIYKGQTCAFII